MDSKIQKHRHSLQNLHFFVAFQEGFPDVWVMGAQIVRHSKWPLFPVLLEGQEPKDLDHASWFSR